MPVHELRGVSHDVIVNLIANTTGCNTGVHTRRFELRCCIRWSSHVHPRRSRAFRDMPADFRGVVAVFMSHRPAYDRSSQMKFRAHGLRRQQRKRGSDCRKISGTLIDLPMSLAVGYRP